MALTVIGKDKALKKQATCWKCSSIIEYLPIDLETWETSCCGEKGHASGFDCPSCGQTLVINSR